MEATARVANEDRLLLAEGVRSPCENEWTQVSSTETGKILSTKEGSVRKPVLVDTQMVRLDHVSS